MDFQTEIVGGWNLGSLSEQAYGGDTFGNEGYEAQPVYAPQGYPGYAPQPYPQAPMTCAPAPVPAPTAPRCIKKRVYPVSTQTQYMEEDIITYRVYKPVAPRTVYHKKPYTPICGR